MSSLPEQTAPSGVAETISTSQASSQTIGRVRLFFLDHLRAALTILVVLHHLAVIYGANAPFYYVEPPAANDGAAFLLLAIMVLVDQAYFMGFFFLISGFFTPGSFDRKGAGAFYKDRLLRLGIPLLIYTFILSPVAFISPNLTLTTSGLGLKPPHTSQELPLTFGVGPLWFAELLLFFGLGYIIWRAMRPRVQPATESVFGPPSYTMIALFIPVLALASYLIRIVIPLGLEIPILGFPTLAYLPQYLSFFIIGIIAFRRNWFQSIPGSMGLVGLIVALVATIVLAPLALSNGSAFLGHGTLQSAAYALWDSTFSVGLCLALLTFFRRCFNRQSRLGSFLARQAFTVYIIHIPVIIILALSLRGMKIEHLLKFALAALIGVPLCFALAFLIRRIPLAARIL